jgi:hypothetical protein
MPLNKQRPILPELRSIPLTHYDCLARYTLVNRHQTIEIGYCAVKGPALNCNELRELGICPRGFA